MMGFRLGLSYGFGAGGGGGRHDPDAPIKNLDLWGGGAPGAWWDVSDLATLFQTADESTPASSTNDPVYRVNDKSGNGNNFIASGGSKRPLLLASNATCLAFDDLDDNFVAPLSGPPGMSVYIAFNRLTDAQFLLGYDATPQNFGVAQSGSSSASYNTVGTPTIRVNGVTVGSTRNELLAACPPNTPVVMTLEGLDFSGWSAMRFGGYPSYQFGGRLFGFLICADQSAGNRNIIEQWLSGKAGIAI
ncbi:hypothetical protein [Martelella sp. FOR1707]